MSKFDYSYILSCAYDADGVNSEVENMQNDPQWVPLPVVQNALTKAKELEEENERLRKTEKQAVLDVAYELKVISLAVRHIERVTMYESRTNILEISSDVAEMCKRIKQACFKIKSEIHEIDHP